MRHPLLFLYAPLLLAIPVESAWAGPLGGFSADESRYLVGQDTICTPIAIASPGAAQAVPACQEADASAIAAMTFRRGVEQRGRDARYAASARGRTLTIQALDKETSGTRELLSWASADPITKVSSVQASPGGRVVAVEYQVRFGGRVLVQVVGFSIPAKDKTSQDEPAGTGQAPDTNPDSGQAADKSPDKSSDKSSGKSIAKAPALPQAALEALDKARRFAKRRKHSAAAKAYAQVLAADPEHAEARYGLARARMYQKKTKDALRELEALAASKREDRVVFLVEARFDKAFARLRADERFRRVTGLSGGLSQPSGLYERLVGFTSTWEQPEVTCENAEVALSLDRLQHTFKLRLTTRCGGYKDTTRLRGTWQLPDGRMSGERVLLTLPNKRAKDEVFTCTMNTCSGEDCLHCVIDRDLDFTLRPVRR